MGPHGEPPGGQSGRDRLFIPYTHTRSAQIHTRKSKVTKNTAHVHVNRDRGEREAEARGAGGTPWPRRLGFLGLPAACRKKMYPSGFHSYRQVKSTLTPPRLAHLTGTASGSRTTTPQRTRRRERQTCEPAERRLIARGPSSCWPSRCHRIDCPKKPTGRTSAAPRVAHRRRACAAVMASAARRAAS